MTGPIAMSYEMVWQAKENSQSLDLSTLLSCLTRSLQLLGNVNNHVSAKRRAQVLSIIGQKYASLSNESWETNGKELFGQLFEQRLKQRSETAKAISTATFVQRGKPFFPRGTPSAKPWNRGGCSQLQEPSFSRPDLSSFQAIQGKGKNNSTLHPVNPSEPVRNPPAHSGMPVKLSVIPSVSKLPLGGRIAHFYQNWQNITNDPWVLETVVGYKIEFLESPHQTYIPSMHASEEERDFIDQEVLSLHLKHAIHKVLKPNGHDPSQFISPSFTVPKKRGWHRPVINLKDLNQFAEYQHFKMEGVPMLKDLLRPKDFLTKIDLKDAYLTVPIWIHHQKFLRFIWRDTLWEFACLPFGLASAPRTFSKLLKPVVAQLRKMGIRLIIYLDDMLIMAESRDLAIEHTTIAVNLLSSLSFVLNEGKSILVPTQELEFLGFLVNSVRMSLYLPRDKVKSIKRECQSLLNNPSVSIRTLSRLLGKLSSSIQAVFTAPLHYRFLLTAKTMALKKTQCYESTLLLNRAAQEELLWWRDHLAAWNGRSLLRKKDDLLIETDASNLGWGACCNGVRTGGIWSHRERLQHINCLELMAGGFAIKSFCKNRASIQVKLLMDNTTAIAYINRMGGSSPVLASLVYEIWQWCLQREISLTAHHIPGIYNNAAD